MNKRMKVVALSTLAVLAVGLGGCGKNGLHGSSGAPIVNGKRDGHGTEVNGVDGASSFSGDSFGGDALAASASLPKVIYFGFDKYNLTGKASDIASQNAALLLKNPSLHVMVEGHTDPRGSESYNFHLGERRANAVQEYFLQHGVAAAQVCTVSYGELRLAASPADFGGNKLKAYALDRRAVLVYNKDCAGMGSDDSTPTPAPVVKKKHHHHAKKKATTPAPVTTTTPTTPSTSTSPNPVAAPAPASAPTTVATQQPKTPS